MEFDRERSGSRTVSSRSGYVAEQIQKVARLTEETTSPGGHGFDRATGERAAAVSATANAAGRMQALATVMLADLRHGGTAQRRSSPTRST
ncbi:hypothetical protein LV779_07270 [Streptomyces thinghirensis]|nr:hypothetical protein [Streptomyces thinghirensis]